MIQQHDLLQEKLAARVDQEDNEEDDTRAQDALDMLEELSQSKEKNNGKCSYIFSDEFWYRVYGCI